MPFEKGKSGSPENKFSETNQPKNRGRRPSIIKQLEEKINIEFGVTLSKSDRHQITMWLLERTITELKAIATDKKTPAFIVLEANAILGDLKKQSLTNREILLSRPDGKPTQPLSTPDGEGIGIGVIYMENVRKTTNKGNK